MPEVLVASQLAAEEFSPWTLCPLSLVCPVYVTVLVHHFSCCFAFPLNLQCPAPDRLNEADALISFHTPLQKGGKTHLRAARRKSSSSKLAPQINLTFEETRIPGRSLLLCSPSQLQDNKRQSLPDPSWQIACKGIGFCLLLINF